ncbi:hypothetical protein JG687_00010122 [Phytophthora cactorum]|uniref:Uncharacterized protein n=1 Tax=Phytophthora cactorum TaxID=29920 RepID=A0A8T1U857_9STRA|nr:hypothetical protein JG687_00010122 [Phytophthora cactorum]
MPTSPNVGHSKRIHYLQTMAMTVTVSRVCSKRRLCTCTNSMPHSSPSAVLWVSSVTSFCYSWDTSARTTQLRLSSLRL